MAPKRLLAYLPTAIFVAMMIYLAPLPVSDIPPLQQLSHDEGQATFPSIIGRGAAYGLTVNDRSYSCGRALSGFGECFNRDAREQIRGKRIQVAWLPQRDILGFSHRIAMQVRFDNRVLMDYESRRQRLTQLGWLDFLSSSIALAFALLAYYLNSRGPSLRPNPNETTSQSSS